MSNKIFDDLAELEAQGLISFFGPFEGEGKQGFVIMNIASFCFRLKDIHQIAQGITADFYADAFLAQGARESTIGTDLVIFCSVHDPDHAVTIGNIDPITAMRNQIQAVM